MRRVLILPLFFLFLIGAFVQIPFLAEERRSAPSDVPSLPATEALPAIEATPQASANADTLVPTYVGREVCKECHQSNYELHQHHGHKSTFALAADPEIAELFRGKTYDAGQPYGTYHYDVDGEGLYVTIPDKFGDRRFRLDYALGSTKGAITLLSLIPGQDGQTIAIEHRASWFKALNDLAPTPQEDPGTPRIPGEFFGLMHEGIVMRKCVYCHTTQGEIENQTVNGLVANVNCEKCHGPASEHVRLAKQMDNPPKFSVGKEDWDVESEIQLCGDCHRLPATISTKKIREYPDELVRFQPVGILRSECYLQSGGQLTCSTCHNPHQSVHEVSKQEHEQNCIACHQQSESDHVACPVSPKSGCIECHMPALELPGLHVGFHDHWIRVHDEQ